MRTGIIFTIMKQSSVTLYKGKIRWTKQTNLSTKLVAYWQIGVCGMRKGVVVRLTCTLNLKVYRKGRKGGKSEEEKESDRNVQVTAGL